MAVASDLVLLDEDELTGRLSDARRELFNLRFQLATGQLDNPARLGLVKRDIARILTVLKEREIEEEEGIYVPPSPEEHAAALAHLAAQDAAVIAAAEAHAASRAAHDHAEDDDIEIEDDDDSDYDDDDEIEDDEIDEGDNEGHDEDTADSKGQD